MPSVIQTLNGPAVLLTGDEAHALHLKFKEAFGGYYTLMPSNTYMAFLSALKTDVAKYWKAQFEVGVPFTGIQHITLHDDQIHSHFEKAYELAEQWADLHGEFEPEPLVPTSLSVTIGEDVNSPTEWTQVLETRKSKRLLKLLKDSPKDTMVRDYFYTGKPGPRHFGASTPHMAELKAAPFPYIHAAGIEIEVENPTHSLKLSLPGTNPALDACRPYFSEKGDGSLRFGGVEYVSNYGTTAGEILYGLEQLHTILEAGRKHYGPTYNNFSFRCGFHVHVDVSELTIEELYKAMLMYCVVEKVLFALSGRRDTGSESKFCLPVSVCISRMEHLLSHGHSSKWGEFVETINDGHKYLACNVRTVGQFNTLEFRHHYGTSDPAIVREWMRLLFDTVLAHRPVTKEALENDVVALGREVPCHVFVKKYFPESHGQIINLRGYEKLLREGAAFVKQVFLSEPEYIDLPQEQG